MANPHYYTISSHLYLNDASMEKICLNIPLGLLAICLKSYSPVIRLLICVGYLQQMDAQITIAVKSKNMHTVSALSILIGLYVDTLAYFIRSIAA